MRCAILVTALMWALQLPVALAAQGSALTVTGALVADGSGGPLRRVEVRVVDGVIAEVGEVRPRAGDRVIDGGGLVLAPGFIDAHGA